MDDPPSMSGLRFPPYTLPSPRPPWCPLPPRQSESPAIVFGVFDRPFSPASSYASSTSFCARRADETGKTKCQSFVTWPEQTVTRVGAEQGREAGLGWERPVPKLANPEFKSKVATGGSSVAPPTVDFVNDAQLATARSKSKSRMFRFSIAL